MLSFYTDILFLCSIKFYLSAQNFCVFLYKLALVKKQRNVYKRCFITYFTGNKGVLLCNFAIIPTDFLQVT